MATPLPVLKKNAFPSLIDTETANKFRGAIEDLRTLKVSPQGYGKLLASDQGVVLDLSGIADVLKKQLKAAQDAAGQDPRFDALNTKVNAIIASLNAASISASCDSSGSVTVTILFPNMPIAT
jgi:hypothetical protein